MKQYLELLRHVLDNGEEHDDRTGVGTISVFGYQMRMNLNDGFPLLTTKKVFFRGVVEELLWFLRGETNVAQLQAKGVHIWDEWATPEQTARFGRGAGDLGPVYGWLWRNFGGDYHISRSTDPPNGVDQIARLLRDLVKSPNSRRHLVTGWDPRECDNVALPPCHTVWQVKVHPARHSLACQQVPTSDCIETPTARPSISLHLYARSIDSFLGLPFNIASYALLTHLLAFVCGYGVRDLIISFGDLHIYKNHLEQVGQQLSRDPRPLPRLHIMRWDNDSIWNRTDGSGGDVALARLMAIEERDIVLEGYDPHPAIKAEVAV
jgi:thymidylate synthase